MVCTIIKTALLHYSGLTFRRIAFVCCRSIYCKVLCDYGNDVFSYVVLVPFK